jgi:hypothetical protein
MKTSLKNINGNKALRIGRFRFLKLDSPRGVNVTFGQGLGCDSLGLDEQKLISELYIARYVPKKTLGLKFDGVEFTIKI